MANPKTYKQLQDHPHVYDCYAESNDYETMGCHDYWVYLNFPYYSPTTQLACIHEYGMKDTLREFKDREINYAFYLSSEWLGRRPQKPETKVEDNGQLNIPFGEYEYKKDLEKYTKKVSDQWNDCMEHCIKYTDQTHIDILYMMFKKFKTVPNYDPDYINYDPKNFTNI